MGYQVPLHEGPILCPHCNVEANFVDSAAVYNGNSFGMIYLCSNWPECDARIGAMGKGRPIGTLARQELRELRRTCHHHFDVLWKGEGAEMTRTEAYAYLQKFTCLPPEEAHIGQFDIKQCQRFLKRWHCKTCRDHPGEPGPSHDGSACCRNMRVLGFGAIAAGGTRAHCTCAACW